MDIVLVPGLWLDGASWDEVIPHLEAAGHRVHPVTLPGLESARGRSKRHHARRPRRRGGRAHRRRRRAGRARRPLGGRGIVHAARWTRDPTAWRATSSSAAFPTRRGSHSSAGSRRPAERFRRPTSPGFEEADLRDLDEAALARFRERAIPSPGGVVQGLHHYTDERRYDVPVTVIAPEFTGDDLREWMAAGHLPELAKVKDLVDRRPADRALATVHQACRARAW